MRRTLLPVLLAAAGPFAAHAFGAFTFSIGTPNTTLIPGKTVVQLYALNNGNTGGNDTGTLIKAFAPVFAVTGGGLYINADVGDPADAADDVVDFPNAAGPSPTLGSAGNGFSYVRLGTAAQTFQVASTPASADPYVTGNSGTGIASFSVTETTTANVNASSTVNGGLGFRVAVLVFNSAATSFTLSGQVGGDIGSAQTISPNSGVQAFNISTTPPIIVEAPNIVPSSVTVDVSPPGLEGFSGVNVASTNVALSNSPIPAQIADNITIVYSGTNAAVSGHGFTYADLGTYVISFTATAPQGTATSTFTLNIIPEPTRLAVIPAVAALGRRRRVAYQRSARRAS